MDGIDGMDKQRRIRPGIVFRLARELGSLPDGLKLFNVEWGILLAVTGEHTVAQIGDHFGLEARERDRAFAHLRELGLIAEQPVSFSQYVRAAATIADDEPRTLARFLRAGAALAGTKGDDRPTASPSAPRPARAAVTSPTPRGVLARGAHERSTGAPSLDLADAASDELTRAVPTGNLAFPAFQPLGDPAGGGKGGGEAPNGRGGARASEQPAAAELSAGSGPRRLSLKALMQLILDRAPDLNSGQLDIYRVFIRVDTRLLKRHGITTLRFTEDHRIADPELEQAIAASLEKTLGLSLPAAVFV